MMWIGTPRQLVVALSLMAAVCSGGVAHAAPGDGCDTGKQFINLASTMVPCLGKTPILGEPPSIQSEGQRVAQGYTFDAINQQVARDLGVDLATAAALMGYTGCEIAG